MLAALRAAPVPTPPLPPVVAALPVSLTTLFSTPLATPLPTAVAAAPPSPPPPRGATPTTPTARLGLAGGVCLSGLSFTAIQSGFEATLRYPARSGNRSISEAMTAGSMLRCSLVVVDGHHCEGCRVFDCVRCTTSRCPISREANCDVPPFSLAEHRKISVLAQFSTMVSATPCPYVLDTCEIEQSVVGIRMTIRRGTRITRSVLLGADFYEEHLGDLPLGIGRNAVLDRVIVDKNARIGDGARLVNERGIQDADGDGYYIRSGIIVVPKGGVVKPGTIV